MTERSIRIALYSHDSMGMGHMRRNLLLAEELVASRHCPSVLLISGSREISRFTPPRGVDVLSLPALYKDSQSSYHARSLDVSLSDLIALRSTTIDSALKSFDPDVFIVDNVPRGAVGELDAALFHLRRRGRARCILGLRDILDDARQVHAEWGRAGNFEAVRRSYDAIWVYGDRHVNDVALEYGFPPDIAHRIRYAGYLDQRMRSEPPAGDATHGRGETVLCLLGGGQDGIALADAFARAPMPEPYHAHLVTGPMMSDARRTDVLAATRGNPRVTVTDFVDNPAAAMRAARGVIAMGGYNTVCDILSHAPRALIVPRVHPRTEQLIRAERLAARGLFDVMHPDAATPQALAGWVATLADTTPAIERHPVRMHTTAGLHALLDEALAVHPRRSLARSAPRCATLEVRHAS